MTAVILIIGINNQVTTPTVVHAQDRDRCCEVWHYAILAKENYCRVN